MSEEKIKPNYIHGVNKEEQQRLSLLNSLTNKTFIEFLDLDNSYNILEIGSGLCILTNEIARIKSNSKITGLEFAKEQIYASKNEHLNLQLIQGDAHSLPFFDDCFDLIYCRYLLEHVKNPNSVLEEINRVLKKNGKLFIQENNIGVHILYPECFTYDKILNKIGILQSMLGGDAYIGKKLFSLLTKTGFRDIALSVQPEIHYYGLPTLKQWITNLIEIVQGSKNKLIESKLSNLDEINKAILELEAFINKNDSSVLFYWNRVSAIK